MLSCEGERLRPSRLDPLPEAGASPSAFAFTRRAIAPPAPRPHLEGTPLGVRLHPEGCRAPRFAPQLRGDTPRLSPSPKGLSRPFASTYAKASADKSLTHSKKGRGVSSGPDAPPVGELSNRPPRRRSGSETRERGGVMSFRATSFECAKIQAEAASKGLASSSYLREVVLRAMLQRASAMRSRRAPTVEMQALSAILAQLGKCGSNLNQIARVLNSSGDAPLYIAEAIEEFRAATRNIQELMGKRPGERGEA
jgi:Bacterial mobilisation protein (MobC)